MAFITLLSIIIICFLFCIVTIRCRAIRAHRELRDFFISLSNQNNGKVKDSGCLEGMSLELNSTKFNVVCKTITEGQRKYSNSYSLLISLIDNHSKIVRFQKKMQIGNGTNQEKITAVINSMLIEQ